MILISVGSTLGGISCERLERRFCVFSIWPSRKKICPYCPSHKTVTELHSNFNFSLLVTVWPEDSQLLLNRMDDRPQKAHHAKQAGTKADRKKAKTNKNQEKNNPKVRLNNFLSRSFNQILTCNSGFYFPKCWKSSENSKEKHGYWREKTPCATSR
jgi:hypothetical protein